jgi:glycerol-3-phosphate dehydrogenase
VVDVRGSRVSVVRIRLSDRSRIQADVVVNAAGPWAGEIAAMAGASLSLDGDRARWS